MANPQQPELARSRKTPALDPDASESVLSAAEAPTVDRPRGPVPEDNRPGHHPRVEQDKPDADRFIAKVKAVAAEAAEADDGASAVEVGPSVEATTAARTQGAAPMPPVPPPSSPADLGPAPASPRADGLAALAGAPWKLASGVLQRLRDRL